MGWGAPKAKAPQPERIEPVMEAEAEPEAAEEHQDPAALAELMWMRHQANKGWLPERRERVLREFIKSIGAYPALLKYAKGLR